MHFMLLIMLSHNDLGCFSHPPSQYIFEIIILWVFLEGGALKENNLLSENVTVLAKCQKTIFKNILTSLADEYLCSTEALGFSTGVISFLEYPNKFTSKNYSVS